MNRAEVNEIKKRFNKKDCSISKIAICYVNSNKEKVDVDIQSFLNLDEPDFYKHLEVAKKVLVSNISTSTCSIVDQDSKNSLLSLKSDGLRNDAYANALFDKIIDTCDIPGNYAIFLYYDAYDVMVKTSDKRSLDESEEVYDYIVCAICPIHLSKASLGIVNDKITSVEQQHVVTKPKYGFVYPAFNNRSSDYDEVFVFNSIKDDDFLKELLCYEEKIEETEGCCDTIDEAIWSDETNDLEVKEKVEDTSSFTQTEDPHDSMLIEHSPVSQLNASFITEESNTEEFEPEEVYSKDPVQHQIVSREDAIEKYRNALITAIAELEKCEASPEVLEKLKKTANI